MDSRKVSIESVKVHRLVYSRYAMQIWKDVSTGEDLFLPQYCLCFSLFCFVEPWIWTLCGHKRGDVKEQYNSQIVTGLDCLRAKPNDIAFDEKRHFFYINLMDRYRKSRLMRHQFM